MTPLTMKLLFATGYYISVDQSENVDMSVFGKDRGCAFAKGDLTPSPQYCQPGEDADKCDFSNVIRGQCQNDLSFQSFGNCNDESANPAVQGLEVRGAQSRCIDNTDFDFPLCFESTCQNSNTQVDVTIQGTVYNCMT